MQVTRKDLRINRRRKTEVMDVSDGTLVIATSTGSVILGGPEKRAVYNSLVGPAVNLYKKALEDFKDMDTCQVDHLKPTDKVLKLRGTKSED